MTQKNWSTNTVFCDVGMSRTQMLIVNGPLTFIFHVRFFFLCTSLHELHKVRDVDYKLHCDNKLETLLIVLK